MSPAIILLFFVEQGFSQLPVDQDTHSQNKTSVNLGTNDSRQPIEENRPLLSDITRAENSYATGNSEMQQLEYDSAKKRSARTEFFLWTSLVFHSLLAGIALGTEQSLSTTIGLWIALIAHKGFAGFALGMKV